MYGVQQIHMSFTFIASAAYHIQDVECWLVKIEVPSSLNDACVPVAKFNDLKNQNVACVPIAKVKVSFAKSNSKPVPKPRFVQSNAWKMQVLNELPQAISESAFLAPSSNLTSNDTRKNFTDMQETAQWLGGTDIPRKLLQSMGVHGTSSSAACSKSSMTI